MSGSTPSARQPAAGDEPAGDGQRLAKVEDRIGEARQAAAEVEANEDLTTPESDQGHVGAFESAGDQTRDGRDPEESS